MLFSSLSSSPRKCFSPLPTLPLSPPPQYMYFFYLNPLEGLMFSLPTSPSLCPNASRYGFSLLLHHTHTRCPFRLYVPSKPAKYAPNPATLERCKSTQASPSAEAHRRRTRACGLSWTSRRVSRAAMSHVTTFSPPTNWDSGYCRGTSPWSAWCERISPSCRPLCSSANRDRCSRPCSPSCQETRMWC